MTRHRNPQGMIVNTPMAWNMVPGACQISNREFLYMVEKGGFEGLPDLLTWEQYEKVLRIFFPWKSKVQLCRRCEGTCSESSGRNCMRCNGQGIERQTTVA